MAIPSQELIPLLYENEIGIDAAPAWRQAGQGGRTDGGGEEDIQFYA